MNRKAIEYLRGIYQLKKRIPCPVPVEDTFRLPRMPAVYPDSAYALRYWQSFHDELHERAAKIQSTEEKLRIMWTCAAPYFANPFQVLNKRNVSIPIFMIDMVANFMAGTREIYGDMTYGKKLTPLEEEARMLYSSGWVGTGKKWIDDVSWVARDLQIDAVVNFMQVGCMATSGLSKLLSDTLENDSGIPVLNIEGRQLMSDSYDKDKFENEIEEFIDMCLLSKEFKNK
jgi:benzoyl-CoA reductase/2-hydroxyglutaryl-CoA dehydratase subunit BcrC/BadD/HgdB